MQYTLFNPFRLSGVKPSDREKAYARLHMPKSKAELEDRVLMLEIQSKHSSDCFGHKILCPNSSNFSTDVFIGENRTLYFFTRK